MRSDARELVVVFADCDFRNEPFYAIGSALVLRVARLFHVCGLRQFRPQPGLQLPDGVFHRRERRRRGCCWNVEVSFWVESFSAEWGCCPEVASPGGDWSLAAFARPVPHRAGSLAAFARLGSGPAGCFAGRTGLGQLVPGPVAWFPAVASLVSSRIDAGGHSRASVTSGPALVIHF